MAAKSPNEKIKKARVEIVLLVFNSLVKPQKPNPINGRQNIAIECEKARTDFIFTIWVISPPIGCMAIANVLNIAPNNKHIPEVLMKSVSVCCPLIFIIIVFNPTFYIHQSALIIPLNLLRVPILFC